MILQLVLFSIVMIALPVFVGELFAPVYKGRGKYIFRWVSGQFMLWAGFQVISVPMILKKANFSLLVWLYVAYIAALILLVIGVSLRRDAFDRIPHIYKGKKREKVSLASFILWSGFWALLAVQVLQAIRMAYGDGDDAFYVSITTATVNADTMYMKDPYTGLATTFEARYGLAPFPIWIAFLSKVTGMVPVMMAQVALPVALICMTYGIFYLIGNRLFPERNGQLPLFLMFSELLILFGDYSFSTAENFMLARTHQGKSVLGNIVIPFLFFLLFVLYRRLQKKDAIPVELYTLFCVAAIAGCMCSTLGALLVCMFVGIAGIVGAIAYKRLRMIFPLVLCCAPCVLFAFLYLVLK